MKKAAALLLALLPFVVVLALYAPALGFTLMGDDYQWVQHAHRASHRLFELFADLDSFYRPTTTWTLALDRIFWSHHPLGFHLTNLLLHSTAAALLFLTARRLELGPGCALVAGLLWAIAPFSEESAVSVAIRFEDLLLAAWFGIALAWPQRGAKGRWGPVASFAVLAMLSKETWIVTPALTFALAWGLSRESAKRSVQRSLPFVAAAVLYTLVYFLAFPGDKNYFRYDFTVLAKLPHLLAAFFHLESPVPLAFPFSTSGLLALGATLALLGVVIKARHPAGVFGGALLFAPQLPTLLVPYLPPRYLVASYAGFLLLVLCGFSLFRDKLAVRFRPVANLGGVALAVLVFLAHVYTVRADLRDWARVSAAHARLVAQAEAVKDRFPLDKPVAVVRADGTNILRDIAVSVEGVPKLFFVRGADPAGLVDAAALFEWVLAREDLEVRPLKEDPGALKRPGAVLLYAADGFHWVSLEEPDLERAVESFRQRGFPVRVVAARPLPTLAF
ncbi:MAG: hypothetical protein ACP5NF_06760 [Thermoanaerobaculum sp.]